MQLEANEAHVWSHDLALEAKEIDLLASLLHPDEMAKAERFFFPVHKNRYIAARAFLRKILSLYLDIPAKDIQLNYDQNGKPYLVDNGIHFNLSHSENQAVYAIARYPVGIDIEQIKENYNPEIASRYFTPQEATLISQLPKPEQAPRFYDLWSRKEAMIKANGKTLSMLTHEFSSLEDFTELDNKRWRLITLNIKPGFATTLVANADVNKLSYWQLNAEGPRLQNTMKLVVY